eukprot:gnl/Hemi2/25064_TR8434_c0_g1_i1.p3 gnl/Hemi2/25064_TR8434_c0_g1~~gnl/Hemi2/25064_TR8434_c0_g1_i1.p3  ORF type:complete len:316 (+),score=85.39 gnl/Hemi2/25064_TR8434_c0_g1_i1:1316-2263(+)
MERIRFCFSILKNMVNELGGKARGSALDLQKVIDEKDKEIFILVDRLKNMKKSGPLSDASTQTATGPAPRDSRAVPPLPPEPQPPLPTLDREAAREQFMKNHPLSRDVEELTASLRAMFAEAKEMGNTINSSMSAINELKQKIEQLRVERAMQGLMQRNGADEDPEEEECRQQMTAVKQRYKDSFDRLRTKKVQIETTQHMLEANRMRVQTDFEVWFAKMTNQPVALQVNPRHSVASSMASLGSLSMPPSLPAAPVMSVANSINLGSAQRPTNLPKPPPTGGGVLRSGKSTGNKAVDEDIRAFLEARDALAKARG